MKIRVAHLYPDYLNIYADRGNIAVLARRALWRGHEVDVEGVSVGDDLRSGAHDLLYIGGGQDREQALVAVDLGAKGAAVRAAVADGAAVLAVGAAVVLGVLAVRWSRRRGAGGELETAPDPVMERRIDDELARLDS